MWVMHFSPVRRAGRSEPVPRRRASWLACLAVLVAALLGCVLPQVASAESGLSTELGASAEPGAISSTPSTTQRYTPCPSSADMVAECNLVIDPVPIATTSGYELPDGSPLLGSGEEGGLDPENLESAYKIPTTGGSSETVALVDAYGDSTAESDLNKYREKYKVYYKGTETACTKTNGCFKKVNVKGEEANYPAAGPEIWGAETALDIEMVSAACPECHILLVEASGEYPAATAAAVEEAAKLKATEISNSYGYSEDDESACPSKKGCKEYLAAYNQGIPVTASAGDGGYNNKNRGYSAPLWPAVSPNVIAVGGTELEKVEKPKEGERGWKEVVWPDSGSGCSLYESEPTWQEAKTVPKACGADRTDNDVASVAEEVSIYTTPYEGGWGNVGGTSASSPFVAGVEAHATSATKKLGADAFYKKPSMLFHISSGSNGSCGAEGSETYYLCHGTKEGYNAPTGMGTPDGVFTSSTPPVVTTGSVTGVTETEGTLHGTVNPNGTETKYYFEYGLKQPKEGEKYEHATTEAVAGSGESNVEVSKTIAGLTKGTTYDYRIVATNTSSETSNGSNQVFETHPYWSLQEPPSPIGGTQNYLQGVSCTSSTACTAVGFFYNTSEKQVPLAEGWNGTSWTVQETPIPAGATRGWLFGVSCISSTACKAAGYVENSSAKLVPAIESWNGTSWTVQELTSPTGAKASYMRSISCASATSCIAVGYFYTSSEVQTPFAESWNGTAWTLQEPPNPTGSKDSYLEGASCTSSTACIAAGDFVSASGKRVPFAESWNGTAWTLQEPPNPTGSTETYVRGVSCTSSTACVAVGQFGTGSGEVVLLAESWNGTAWSVQEPPRPTGKPDSYLYSVLCTSSTTCMAIGDYVSGSSGRTPLAESWNGTAWSLQEPPIPSGAKNSYAQGVSCTSSTACTAIGFFENSSSVYEPLAERYG